MYRSLQGHPRLSVCFYLLVSVHTMCNKFSYHRIEYCLCLCSIKLWKVIYLAFYNGFHCIASLQNYYYCYDIDVSMSFWEERQKDFRFWTLFIAHTRRWKNLPLSLIALQLHCIALCVAFHCIALHCIALHCIASHRIALHCIVSVCFRFHFFLHYI
jgi:hypothetical protein